MERKELLNYAIKGLGVDIAENELKISKGLNIINRLNKGEQVKTTKSQAEILQVIENYRQKRDELIAKRDNLLFDEMMIDDDIMAQERAESIIKVALSSILNKDIESLGNLFIEEMAEILNQITLKPYCAKLGKRYDLLTAEDREIIAEMQMNDYIDKGERWNEEDE